MKLTINGQEVDGVNAKNVAGLLEEQKVKASMYVSVELNGKILKRDRFGSAKIHDGDHVEFLYFIDIL